MTSLILAALFLLATHFVSSTPLRPWAVSRIGEEAWLAGYSVVSLVAFGWLIQAWRAAPVVWWATPSPAVQHTTLALMPVAVCLVVASVLSPNPALVKRDRLLDREPVGILRVTRHPMLWGIGLWAVLHIAANPDQASGWMFGALAILSFAGAALQDRKKRRDLGIPWRRWEEQTSNIPFVAIATGRTSLRLDGGLAWQIPLGLVVYGGLVAVHPWLAGVGILPG